MLGAEDVGKMQQRTRVDHNVQIEEHQNEKRRLRFRKAAFLISNIERGSFLSLAGLAATYSPRA